jgi:hypothetical protein
MRQCVFHYRRYITQQKPMHKQKNFLIQNNLTFEHKIHVFVEHWKKNANMGHYIKGGKGHFPVIFGLRQGSC